MNFTEVFLLKDREIIPSLEGTVSKIRPPKPESELTDPQRKRGIHPQSLALVNDDGIELWVQIIKAGLHLDPSIRGKRLRFSASNNEGAMLGLQASVYNGKTEAVVSSGASITVLKEEPKTETKQSGATPPSKPAFRLLEIGDHITTLENIFIEFVNRLRCHTLTLDGYQTAELAQKLATTVYIQASKDGLIRAQSSTKQVTEPKPEPPKAEQTIEKFARLITEQEAGAKSEIGKELMGVVEMGLFSYKDLASSVRKSLPDDKRKSFDDEFAKVKAMLLSKKESADKSYEIICLDMKAFLERVNDEQIPY